MPGKEQLGCWCEGGKPRKESQKYCGSFRAKKKQWGRIWGFALENTTKRRKDPKSSPKEVNPLKEGLKPQGDVFFFWTPAKKHQAGNPKESGGDDEPAGPVTST